MLDELTAAGLSRTPMFALLTWDDSVSATVNVIARGAVRVTLDTESGAVVVSGTGVSTWVERSIDGVRRVEVCAPEIAEPHSSSLNLPLVSGMVRTRRVLVAFVPAGSAPARISPPPVAAPAPRAASSSVPTPAGAGPASEQTITDIRPAGDDADRKSVV